MSDKFINLKEYIIDKIIQKNQFVKEQIQVFKENDQVKLSIQLTQTKCKALVESLNEIKTKLVAFASELRINLNLDTFLLKWKYRKIEKYIIFGGIVILSCYGFYFIYSKIIYRENSDREFLEEAMFNDSMYKALTSDINSRKILLATNYNKSKNLKPLTSSNKMLDTRIKHESSLSEALNMIYQMLEQYPSLMIRPFKTVNSQTVDIRSQFRIMQWNGLAKNSVKNLKSPMVPMILHDWENFRKWRVLEELLRYNCDIICIQEVDFYEDIKPFLHGLGYASVFCPKMYTNLSKEANKLNSDGCAIFYNLEVFQITQLRSQSICLNGEHDSQGFIIMQLKHKFTKKRVTITCVHLKAYNDFASKRAQQIEFVLNVMKEHVLQTEEDSLKNLSVILCGDMNGDFTEKFYSLIINNDMFKFRDAYPKFEKSNRRQKNAIDYIFYTGGFLNLINFLEMEVPAKKKHFEIPSLEYPSDHFSLICDFQIK